VYAQSKLAGDTAVLEGHPSGGMVIRTSWVYAQHGNNFVNTMLRLGAERPTLNVVFDQIGTPTYAPDLAAATLYIVDKVEKEPALRAVLPGIWHYSNEGLTSWYDFAVAIMHQRGLACKVLPIESSAYPTPVERPKYSVLHKGKIKTAFGLEIPHWQDGLRRCLERT
jgi:dTDP-4-dehydrorhamnose reductase